MPPSSDLACLLWVGPQVHLKRQVLLRCHAEHGVEHWLAQAHRCVCLGLPHDEAVWLTFSLGNQHGPARAQRSVQNIKCKAEARIDVGSGLELDQ